MGIGHDLTSPLKAGSLSKEVTYLTERDAGAFFAGNPSVDSYLSWTTVLGPELL